MVCPHCGAEHEGTICPTTGHSVLEPGPCGSRIDRYDVISRLGAGGFGTVYRARHVHTLRAVALKLGDPSADLETLERFKREAQIASSIRSRHVVEVMDWGVLPTGQAFLVMELLEGRDLASELAARGALSVDRVMVIGAELLRAVAAVHVTGAIHRDIKPSNVFLAREQDETIVKLLDFGCSRSTERGDVSLTRTGTTIGTPQYMAPEQLRGEPCDARTDVFACAAVLYEALANRRPHEGTTYEDLVARVCSEDPTALSERCPGVPAHVARAIMRGLQRAPAQRWPTVTAFSRALAGSEDAPTEQALRLTRPAPDPIPTELPRSAPTPVEARASKPGHPRLWIGALVGAAVIATAIGLLIGRENRETSPPNEPPILPHLVRDAVELEPDATIAIVPKPAAATLTAPTAGPVPESRGRRCDSDAQCPRFHCACKRDNLNAGSCDRGSCRIGPAACSAACSVAGGWLGTYRIAVPATEADCATSPQCASSGACLLRLDQPSHFPACVKSCRDLSRCRVFGECTDVGEGSAECIATRPEDCAASSECTARGLCSLVDRRCVVASSSDCAAAEPCTSYGRCSAVAGTCEAVTDADCTTVCAQSGRCARKGGWCIPTAQGCKQSTDCRNHGSCSLVDGQCKS